MRLVLPHPLDLRIFKPQLLQHGRHLTFSVQECLFVVTAEYCRSVSHRERKSIKKTAHLFVLKILVKCIFPFKSQNITQSIDLLQVILPIWSKCSLQTQYKSKLTNLTDGIQRAHL